MCLGIDALTSNLDIAGAWEALLVFDILIFILTIAKTYRNWCKPIVAGRISLYSLILRDGMYYIRCLLARDAEN